MLFSQRVLLSLVLGILVGLFFGELVAPLNVVADGYIRLLQMTVLPYVVLSITSNLGSLSYAQARLMGLRAGAIMVVIWLTALGMVCVFPLALPHIESASFFSPAAAAQVDHFNIIELYIPSNPFHSLANNVVPAVVLFSVLIGLALIGVERRQPLLDVLNVAAAAVGRVARFIVNLAPLGIFVIAAHTAGTLDVAAVKRVEVYLVAYAAFALLLALWILPGLIAALTPIGAIESLSTSKDALLTAFLVGDLFIILPSLVESCSSLIKKRIDAEGTTHELPSSIIPTSFTFPHAGKLLSMTFVLFAAWLSNSAIALVQFPQLALAGFLTFFGSLNVAVPFLLDMFRLPADTFQLFLATSVVNSRIGTLVAATNTIAIGLLGSAAIAGKLRIQPARLIRFAGLTMLLLALVIVGLRTGFALLLDTRVDGRTVVNSLLPMVMPVADDRLVIAPADVTDIPRADRMLEDIRHRGTLRVGLISEGIPYQYRNDRGQLIGLDVEMAQLLARDLGVGLQFVRFLNGDLVRQVQERTVDIVMTGARATPERAAQFAMSDPYLEETLAVVTLDHRRSAFRSWAAIREMGAVRLGVQDLPYYLEEIQRLLPEAQLLVIPETRELIDPDAPYDAYLLPAERGSILTMLNPRFTVVVPEGVQMRMPLAYPIAGNDPQWSRYVNTWVGLKKREGLIDDLYSHWILGQAAQRRHPRWSVLRDVLHWVR